jgi:hypothetical protein
MTRSENFGSSKNDGFSPIQKIANKLYAQIFLKCCAQNFILNISKKISYHNLVDYQFSTNLELVYYT